MKGGSAGKRMAFKASAGLAVATPTFALFQATLLLLEYRMNHGDAPRPDSPSRGVVVATADAASKRGMMPWFGSSGNSDSSIAGSKKPLRILVIGDSLAAGVGVSQSSVPILPQAIAQSLSQANQGRAVHWTCIGTPGYSSTQILQEIYELPDEPPTLGRRLEEWQRDQRLAAQNRLEQTRRKANSWWQRRKLEADLELASASNDVTPKGFREKAGIIWQRTTKQIQRDWQGLRSVFLIDQNDDTVVNDSVHGVSSEKDEYSLLKKRHPTKRPLIRKDSALHPAVVGDYDVAIVLTGLNDLKDTFLPFMMSTKRAEQLKDARKENNSGGLRDNLVLLVDALRSRMSSDSDPESERTKIPKEDDRIKTMEKSIYSEEKPVENVELGPLMVFPAMPTAPVSLSQVVPLRWFLLPVIRSMDRNKQILADIYPELVLFVKAPSEEVFFQAENQLGPLWENLDQEHVWLKLTDIAHLASERVERLMQAHYESWLTSAGDEQGQYCLAEDSIAFLKEWEFKTPGSSLISPDGIHPNDEGYKAWGRIIGQAIVEEWQRHS